MHLTVVVTLFVSLCYSSSFDFESYNIQWEVPLPVGSILDFPLPEESNLSDLTTVLPFVILADVAMTSVIPNVVNVLDYSASTAMSPVVTLADLDLEIVGIDQVSTRHAKASRSHLLDSRTSVH